MATLVAALCLPSWSGAQRVEGPRAFAIEAAGGAVGGAIGFSLGAWATKSCDVEDTRCLLKGLAGTLVASVAASTAGTEIAGRAADTGPSVLGAFLGSAVGMGAALGLQHLISEEAGIRTGFMGTLILVAVTEGAFAAAGSRLLSKAGR